MHPPKGTTAAERRTAARQQVAYRLDVVATNGSAGCLLDISSSGMRVRFKSEIEVSSVRSLSVVFPRWLELGGGLDLSGRFVWVRNTSSGATEAGFAFDGLSRKDDGVLSVLIQRLAEALAEDHEGS